MVIVLEGDAALFNQYGVMAVNPEKFKTVKYKEAMEFVNWIISREDRMRWPRLRTRTATRCSSRTRNNVDA